MQKKTQQLNKRKKQKNFPLEPGKKKDEVLCSEFNFHFCSPCSGIERNCCIQVRYYIRNNKNMIFCMQMQIYLTVKTNKQCEKIYLPKDKGSV